MGLESVLRRIDRLGYPVWANRVTAASYLAVPAGAAIWFSGPLGSMRSFAGCLLFSAGLAALGVTKLGLGTRETYRRSKAHIERHGRLDERFARAVILGARDGENGCYGYCQEQGLYLAARDSGELETFERARREHSTLFVPHF